MALKFYTNPMSRGQIVRWALHEVGADYDANIIAYGEEMESPDYRAINPMGKVPAIIHEGKVVTECAAICHYLAEAFPSAGLLPGDDEKADYFRWLFFAAGPLEAAVSNKSAGFDPEGEMRRRYGYGHFDLVVDTLDQLLDDRDFVVGDRFTMADVYLGSHVGWGIQFGTLPERDSFKAYGSRVMRRDAFKAAKAIDQELIAKMETPKADA